MFKQVFLAVLSLAVSTSFGCAAGSTGSSPLRIGITWVSQADGSSIEADGVRGDQGVPYIVLDRSKAKRVSHVASDGRSAFSDAGPNDKCDRKWHLDIAFRGSHTKLSRTEQQLDRRLDLPMKLDVFGVFDHPTTPIDRKTNLQLMSFAVGVGREENDYLVWTLYGGGVAASDHNHQRAAVAQLDVDFKYALGYVGVSTEVYPWRIPRRASGLTWEARLRASRPYFTAGFETGYVSGEGRGEYSVGPVTLYKDGVTIRDWTFSWPIGVGWTVPLSERWSYHLVGDYRFHLYRPDEYNGWNFTSALRRRF